MVRSKKTRFSKTGRLVGTILMYLFLALCLFALAMTIFSERDIDGTAELFGYQMRIISSDSMAKCALTDVSEYEIGSIPLRSMVFIEVVPKTGADEWYRSLRIGDVLTFRYVYTGQVTITHRIVSIEEKKTGGFLIELAGDNKNSDTGQLTQIIDTSAENSTDYVIGKVTGQAFFLGVLVNVLKTPPAMVLVVMVPCIMIILLESMKIVGVCDAQRKKREREERMRRNGELAYLRRRLAELETQQQSKAEWEEGKI